MFLGYSELVMDRILGDHLANPWFDQVAAIGFTMFMLGLLFYWIHQRLNDARIYQVLAAGLGVNGAILLVFGRDPFPNPVNVVIFFASMFFWVAGLVAVLTVFIVKFAPDMGLPERYVQDVDDHTPNPRIPYVLSTALLVIFWLSVSTPFYLLNDVLGLGAWALAVAMIGIVSTVSYALLPVRFVRETALLGETAPPKEIEDIFSASGPATPMEKMTVPLVSVAFWGAGFYFALNGLDLGSQDFTGVCILVLIGGSILYTEHSRSKRVGEAETDADRAARKI